jgi:predicted MFS family arabinose efflux permease
LQAYVGTQVPFARRGQAVGLSELAWAASSLVGIPAAGWLVQGYDWNTPFVVMGVLGVGGSLLLRRVLPCNESVPRVAAPHIASPHIAAPHIAALQRMAAPQWMAAHRVVLRFPAAKTMLFYAFLAGCACDIFFVTYALWLTESLGIGVMALGLATIAIGIAELSGDLLTATLADRFGLRRTVLATLVLAAASYALLPLWSFSTVGTLTGIFLACLAFEFNFVAAMSLCTEVRPSARATMMSMFQASSGMGHVVGVLIGGLVWFAGGIAGVGLVCAALCLVALVAVHKGLAHWRAPAERRHPKPHSTPPTPATDSSANLPIW